MLKTFARRLSRRLGNVLKLLSAEDIDDSILDKEKNLYKRGIIKASRAFDMYEEEVLTGADLAEAITRIGYLAYAGGPPATKSAGTYLPQLADILGRPEVRGDLKVAILKTISIITVNHLEHQDQCANLGLIRVVADIISDSSESVLMWAIYCMHNMIVGNIRTMQMIVEDASVQQPLEDAAALSWNGYQHNYAADLMKLLGLEREVDTVERANDGDVSVQGEGKRVVQNRDAQSEVGTSEVDSKTR